MPLRAPSLYTSPRPGIGPERDWTHGPARTAAAIVLGAASVVGLSWAIVGKRQPPELERGGTRAATVAPAVSERPGGASASAAHTDAPSRAPRDTGVAAPINLNTAGATELQLLPGIGPALAARIIADREANGPFASVEDLDRVRGIGPRTIEKLRDLASTE
ncbi:MAG: ComEA family DNA-binding protein [Phycisphaerales bacterium]